MGALDILTGPAAAKTRRPYYDRSTSSGTTYRGYGRRPASQTSTSEYLGILPTLLTCRRSVVRGARTRPQAATAAMPASGLAPNIRVHTTRSGLRADSSHRNRAATRRWSPRTRVIHTFGWGTGHVEQQLHPPNACPEYPATRLRKHPESCSRAEPTYWLENTVLDAGHDDYTHIRGGWWDRPGLPWISHLNELRTRSTSRQGSGPSAPSPANCRGRSSAARAEAGHSTGKRSAVVLTGRSCGRYTRVVWGGAWRLPGRSRTAR